MIDFVSNDKGLIWRGSKGSRLQSKLTPEQRNQDIQQTVASILERFPPKS